MAQQLSTIVNNRNIFSSHYLESLIKGHPEWNEDVTDAFNRARKIYNSRTEWNRMGESMLEEFLIRPVLKDVLGHHFIPQAKVEKSSKRPDYALFETETDLNEAIKNSGTDDFYLKAAALGEAKSWKTLLDKKIKGVKASFEFQNPSFQIDYYLHVTPVQWGILTNGHQWRLYNKETSYKLDSYYEIDLATILEKKDIEGFKYFYLFFRLEAFKKDASRKNFLDRVNEGSLAYAKKLGDNLQKNVYEAMELLSIGFLSHQENSLTKNENDLKVVQENTLKLLYRLLFIFFAESRKLLDIDNPEYKKLSLESIKYDIANKKDSGERILSVTTDYWNKLNTLFALINEGSESERFKIAKDILYIPAYNGGLFDPERNPFLHGKKIGDEYIAKAIDLMAREDKEFIDYSTLGTRQLGSIYEGLLEYKLKVATEDLAAVKEKGHEKWLTKKEAEGKKSFFEIKAGEIYLATDKGERKATGSYYTPDYIVKYIVRNTLGPILDEKRAAWGKKGVGERPFLHDILSVRVLDPAMGSGHFLVEACEFLANKLVEAWGEARPEDLESEEVAEHDVHWARREVVRHCIFGVDLNPMAVELAKLSLWLETVAANKPLTFLDHHLKVGNSLIGAKVEDLKSLPSKEKKAAAENGKKQLKTPTLWDFTVKKHFEELLTKYGEFAAHPDDDLKSVKLKEQEYDALQKSEINRRLHELANVWVSSYFGAAPPPDEYAEMQNEMNPKDFPDWSRWRGRDWFRRAQEIAVEKRFFHWELEFPESFYEKGAPKENPGWDAVVGNPPYVRQEQLGIDKEYFRLNYEVHHGNADLCVYFFERSHKLLKKSGLFGFISSNKFMRANYGAFLRNFLLKEIFLKQIIDFGDLPIFPDATTYPCIVITQNDLRKGRNTIFVPVKSLDFDLLDNVVKSSETLIAEENFKGHNWSLAGSEERKILDKIRISSNLLDEYTQITPKRGILTGLGEAFVINDTTKDKLIKEDPKSAEIIKPFLMGEDVGRYNIDYKGRYLIWTYVGIPIESYPAIFNHLKQFQEKLEKRWDKGKYWWELRSCDYYKDFDTPKIVYLVFQVKPAFYLDNDGFYCNNAVWIIPNDNKFLVSILNSKLGWYLISKSCTQIQNGYQLIWDYFKNIPIRRISFTTPPDRRAALVEQAKALCSAEAPDSVKKLLDFVVERLSAAPEESDVVHDLLAYLAERMIEMNKEKNAEIKSFLDFLRGEIGTSVEELANKTAIQEYYKHEFQILIDVLGKNKKKMKAGYDSKSPANYKHLFEWYSASVSNLKPLIGRIEATDRLIDQIVYRLYGLTPEEIAIVEDFNKGR